MLNDPFNETDLYQQTLKLVKKSISMMITFLFRKLIVFFSKYHSITDLVTHVFVKKSILLDRIPICSLLPVSALDVITGSHFVLSRDPGWGYRQRIARATFRCGDARAHGARAFSTVCYEHTVYITVSNWFKKKKITLSKNSRIHESVHLRAFQIFPNALLMKTH